MRAFLLISVIVHIALLAVIAVPYQRQAARGETTSVELVPSSQAPAFNEEPAASGDQRQSPPQRPRREEAAPDFSKLRLSEVPAAPADDQKQYPALSQQQASQQSTPQQSASQQSRAQPQPQQQAAQRPSAQAAQQQPPAQGQQPAAEQSKAEPSKGEQQAAGQPALQQPNPEQPNPEPPASDLPAVPADTLADQGERLAALMNIPGNGLGDAFGSAAETQAKLSADEIARFKTHLKTCWNLPAGISKDQQVKVVIRVALRRDGTLAAQPTLIEAAASEMGLPVYKNGVAALKQCAPYSMLPVEKYKEWRVLDINVSPDEMAGG